jgi:hypothetical protein
MLIFEEIPLDDVTGAGWRGLLYGTMVGATMLTGGGAAGKTMDDEVRLSPIQITQSLGPRR